MKHDDEKWIGPLVSAEVQKMNEAARKQFAETVRKIDDMERDCALRKLIADVWGHRTYMVAVERG